jgi:hypothetical protein
MPSNFHTALRTSTRYICLLLFLVGILSRTHAQNSRLTLQSMREKAVMDSLNKMQGINDTMLHFNFPPIEIKGDYQYKNRKEERKYYQLYEDVKRTYPLSKIVSSEIKLVNAELDSIYKTKAQKKAYLKWYEKHTFNTYVDTLKSLNIRQIKLFIKLIDRETGNSPFELIKKYRGGLDAMLWQLTANALLVNLKSDYDPLEDKMIEDIIVRFY